MTDNSVRANSAATKSSDADFNLPQPRSKEEARVWAILEQARQEIKPKIQKELQGEVVGADILSLRLK